MHDIDRTQMETWESGPYEAGPYEFETYQEFESPFNEADEMELASELLEVSDEEELEQFLGSLIKKASGAFRGFAKSAMGQQLIQSLKGLAKQYLPVAGAAVGNLLLPGVGGAMGSQLAGAIGQKFGLELEGLSAEDQEFEVARQFVKFAGEAARQASETPPNVPPTEGAKSALVAAAQQHAPGLLQPNNSSAAARTGYIRRGKSGRWVRHGRTVILFGV